MSQHLLSAKVTIVDNLSFKLCVDCPTAALTCPCDPGFYLTSDTLECKGKFGSSVN